ncbi:VOC family protein [Streptomyces fungicidicus]|jgi:predicted 3-demethylubiquinone-9 3-methyltransferase (glyoxalase superfamily)|uniref:VOC family protein n=2 Tax=Streptomyces TaxID=1883 RepID=A0A494UUD6_9ACTN|nr:MULTISPECIES: VOC family protein [Streptomyces]AYL34051.1 VOC family protein [Streptomyces fungicidicus]EFL43442.1 PhnB protein [Streptomyces griseoflavus Tu4000]
MQKINAFLMFEGQAEEAMNFYVATFNGAVDSVTRYGPEGPGPEGSVLQATFTLGGQQYMCIDSHVKHGFTFTPSLSLFVTCDDEAELDRLFTTLGEGGGVLMPLSNYGFSTKFGWVNDRYGVSWQLNLP